MVAPTVARLGVHHPPLLVSLTPVHSSFVTHSFVELPSLPFEPSFLPTKMLTGAKPLKISKRENGIARFALKIHLYHVKCALK